jgi:hypothetical protein
MDPLDRAIREMEIREQVIRDWPERIVDLNAVDKIVREQLGKEASH